jgi:hypothetical protein
MLQAAKPRAAQKKQLLADCHVAASASADSADGGVPSQPSLLCCAPAHAVVAAAAAAVQGLHPDALQLRWLPLAAGGTLLLITSAAPSLNIITHHSSTEWCSMYESKS